MSKEMFVALSEANNLNNGRLRVNLDLPFGLDEKINVNATRMDFLRQVAGFNKVIITRDYDAGTSQFVPQIDGINMDGTAISRKAVARTVPTGTFDTENDKNNHINRACWPELKIKINAGEIQQRILDRKESVQDKQIWSREINKISKKMIAEGGTEHLLGLNRKWSLHDKIDTLWSYVSPFFLNGLSLTPAKLLEQFLRTNMIFSMLDMMGSGIEKKDRGYRVSLTLGPEIERAIILNVCSKFGTLFGNTAEKI